MILSDDKYELLVAEAEDSVSTVSSVTMTNSEQDVPPEYTPSEAPPPSDISNAQPATPSAELRPTNMLYLSRTNAAVRGAWLLDPTLHIPDSVLAPLQDGAERKNMSLKSRNGPISADVRVAPSEGPRPLGERTTLEFSAHNGSISVRIRKPEGEKVSVNASSWNGSTTIYLPRSFLGPISLTTSHGSIKCSPSLISHSTLFTEDARTQRAFVGDPTASGWARAPDAWRGDELVVETKNGSVKVMYIGDDEPVVEEKKGKNVVVSMSFEWKRGEGERQSTGWGRWLPWGS